MHCTFQPRINTKQPKLGKQDLLQDEAAALLTFCGCQTWDFSNLKQHNWALTSNFFGIYT